MTIIDAGVEPGFQKYLRDKIRTSNQIALIMAVVGVCYTVFSIIFYPPLTIYPSFCIFLSLGAIVLNYIGYHQISRFILSTLVILLAYLYHGFLVQPGEPMITSLIVIEFSLSVIPWVLIDFREKVLLVISLLACYLLIFSQSWANEVLSLELDSSLFRSGFLNIASFVFSVLILVLCLYFMQIKNYKAELSNESLMQDVQMKNAEMSNQQTQMKKNIDELNAARELENQQNWISKGIAEITLLFRQGGNKEVYDEILSSIIKYTNANQGGIYLLIENESNEQVLELSACYAYDRIKFLNKQIMPGQGLVGQCYLEKETILLRELPEDYINITSGLGDAPPTFVIILPLKSEQKIAGVMELAFFHELQDYQIEFLTRLAETIASFIITNSMNSNTKRLLEQSQLQMEQLRAQEEEMRQNMEELQATQEEMHRKEKEYVDRIAEMDQVIGNLQKSGSKI